MNKYGIGDWESELEAGKRVMRNHISLAIRFWERERELSGNKFAFEEKKGTLISKGLKRIFYYLKQKPFY